MLQSAAIGSCSSFFYQGFQSTLMQRTTNRNRNAGRQLAKPRHFFSDARNWHPLASPSTARPELALVQLSAFLDFSSELDHKVQVLNHILVGGLRLNFSDHRGG